MVAFEDGVAAESLTEGQRRMTPRPLEQAGVYLSHNTSILYLSRKETTNHTAASTGSPSPAPPPRKKNIVNTTGRIVSLAE